MSSALSPGSKLGRYEIRSKIGEGGMGEVYLARDTKLDREIALKILPADVATHRDRMSRFVQEAKAASALNHPNIITIHEIEQIDSVNFIATEFIDGATLRERMKTAPLKLGDVLDVATQVASALSAAHAAGIIHRDIKPENVMLRRDGIVKVLDFGLAKLTERLPSDWVDTEAPTSFKTDPGTVVGTAVYMSPEQARGLDVDARTDIFSFGVVLYEMVAGCLPFEGSTLSEVLASILSDKEPQPLARYSREVPTEMERIVSKSLRKEREQRYQTIKDLLIDLKDLKRELELQAQLENRITPESPARTTKDASEPAIAETSPAQATPTSADTKALQTSSAEYIVSQITRHKYSALLALVALLLGVVAVSYYFTHNSRTVNKTGATAAIDSIAVLPFTNMNGDPNAEYLSDGITESIISSLSQLSQLRVMARSTVFRYKGKDADPQKVGHDLGVGAVLMGRVIQQGDNLTIRTELVSVADGTELWGQQYNRKLTDVFAVQEEIAKEISEKLRLKLTGAERQQIAKRPTENLKAFQYYMQGRAFTHRRTREDLLTAISYCEKAIAEDSNYALAYAGLADAYSNLGARAYIEPIEGRRKADEAARKALALDENLAEAHFAFSQANVLFAPYNLPLANRELRRAIELSPSLAAAHQYLGISLAIQGRFDDSLAEYSKGRELDPLSSSIARGAAFPYYLKRDYARALEMLRKANELGPAFSIFWEVQAYIQNGSFTEALAELEKAKRDRKGDQVLILSTGMVYAAQGKRAEALRIIKELEEMSGASLSQAQYIARIYAALNEKDLALTWLERGLGTGAIGAFYKDEPVWDPIRSDPRYSALLQRTELPQ